MICEVSQSYPLDPSVGLEALESERDVVDSLQSSSSGNLRDHKEQVMLRVAHEDIQLDAHEITLFKAGPPL